jgi:hypothetical protein
VNKRKTDLGSSQKVGSDEHNLRDTINKIKQEKGEMKRRLITGLWVLVLLTGITQATETKSVPMKGDGDGTITSVTPGPTGLAITAVGDGEATHLGKFTREENILLNPGNGTITGTIVFTAADGSELACELSGAFTSPTTAAGTYTFTGGTGRFEGASGSAYFVVVQSDPANFTFEFAGTIDMN